MHSADRSPNEEGWGDDGKHHFKDQVGGAIDAQVFQDDLVQVDA